MWVTGQTNKRRSNKYKTNTEMVTRAIELSYIDGDYREILL